MVSYQEGQSGERGARCATPRRQPSPAWPPPRPPLDRRAALGRRSQATGDIKVAAFDQSHREIEAG